MLRTFPTARILALTSECAPMVNIPHQAVRWARKPIWMGTAKSKQFRVPVKPTIPEEEREELKRLFNKYRTEIKSIRRFLTYKHSVLLMAKSDTEQLRKAFDEDLSRCNEINQHWNEQVRIEREERIARELRRDMEFATTRRQRLEIERELSAVEAEEIVRREKGFKFITAENIDEAIEFALNNPADYNFAIDLEGKKIVGSEPISKKAV